VYLACHAGLTSPCHNLYSVHLSSNSLLEKIFCFSSPPTNPLCCSSI